MLVYLFPTGFYRCYAYMECFDGELELPLWGSVEDNGRLCIT
jgi:hypothetical protein